MKRFTLEVNGQQYSVTGESLETIEAWKMIEMESQEIEIIDVEEEDEKGIKRMVKRQRNKKISVGGMPKIWKDNLSKVLEEDMDSEIAEAKELESLYAQLINLSLIHI